MERKPSGRKRPLPDEAKPEKTIKLEDEVVHVPMPSETERVDLHPTPQGYKVWQLIAVSKSNQRMIFSDDGEHWFNFDGTTFA
jgi:hypothetical protein